MLSRFLCESMNVPGEMKSGPLRQQANVQREAVLIVNPVSGGRDPEQRRRILQWLVMAGLDARLAFTDKEHSAARLAREAVDGGARWIIIAGGDGTVSAAARELVHREAVLAILPAGTFNNMARSFKIPLDLEQACAVVGRGRTRRIDVAILNGEVLFFEAVGVGLDAALFPLGEQIKEGQWTRLGQALKLSLRYRPQPVELEFDRTVSKARDRENDATPGEPADETTRRIRREALMTIVANGPYYGSAFTVAPEAQHEDELLNISIYHNFSKAALLRHFWAISRGRRHYSPKIEQFSAEKVVITSPRRLPVHADGVPQGYTPATVEVVKKALTVCIP